jgi:ABC-type multidrug transport system fused ATPase/permease subunit
VLHAPVSPPPPFPLPQGRTLAAFSRRLQGTLLAATRQGAISGTGRGFSQFMSLSAYALAFWAGAIFISQGTMGRQELLRSFLAIALTSQAIGRISSLAPDSAKAMAAARNVFKVLDMPPHDEDAKGGGQPQKGAPPTAGSTAAASALIDPLNASLGRRDVGGGEKRQEDDSGSSDSGGLRGRLEFRNVS